jgi:hypothetical protein
MLQRELAAMPTFQAVRKTVLLFDVAHPASVIFCSSVDAETRGSGTG